MKRVAFIPVRGGSKSIPLKNIKPLAGKPLLYWALQAAVDTPLIDEVVVATDHDQIAKLASEFPSDKVRLYKRDPVNAQDTSSTESVMLEYLEKAGLGSEDLFILVQVTNPFLKAAHLAGAVHLMEEGKFDSLLSVVRTKRFFWTKDGTPLNYDFRNRPRRQNFEGWFMENGSFYISSVGNILKFQNRLNRKVGVYEMPEISGLEIDEPVDWIIAEELLKGGML